MEIRHIRPNYENKELEEKVMDETTHRICRKLAVERNRGKRCDEWLPSMPDNL